MTLQNANLPVLSPDVADAEWFTDPSAAVDRLEELYTTAVHFLCEAFTDALGGTVPKSRFRAYYPEVRVTTTSYASIDSRLSFGHVAEPGTYATTITRPDLFRHYLEQQISLVIENHGVSVQVLSLIHI